MSNTATDCQTSEVILREQRRIYRERLSSNPGLIIGPAVFIPIALAAIVIPAVVSVDPNKMAIVNRLKGPSLNHSFSTDEFDRDLMIHVFYGTRISLLVGGIVVLLSCVLGTVTSIYASYSKILDHVLIRIYEGLIVIPGVLLAIALIATLGVSNLNVIIALIIVYIPNVARIVHSSALVTRGLPHVEAVKVQGAGNGRILRKLIPPGVVSPPTVQASFIFAQVVISEVSLSFLGAGIPAPAASWGNTPWGSKQVLRKASWTVLFPGLIVVLCVFSLNLLGDGLWDYLDPHTAGRKKG